MSSSEQVTKAQMLRARLEGAAIAGQNGTALAVDDAGKFEALMSVLDPRGLPGKMKGGRVGFYVKDGKLQAAIGWPAAGAVGFVVLPGFLGAFEEVDRLLAEDKVQWHKDEPRRGSGGF